MKSIEQLMTLEPGLEYLGLTNLKKVHWNHCTPMLYEHAVQKGEAMITHLGPLALVHPGKSTGRAPRDRFIVKDENTANKIHWGDVNVPCKPKNFDFVFERVKAYLQDREIYVEDAYAGADETYRVPIRVITEFAWQALFARNLLIRVRDRSLLPDFKPGFTVFALPKFLGNPELDELNSETFILVNFTRKIILIGGTYYGGEIKKSVFTVLNYLLPQQKVLSMHCSANVGKDGDTALFFGLSGTGKTTLSADPARSLIGDDEHGWSDSGIFNFEGGCYAKVIRLSKKAEPEIYETTRKFGTILENVAVDPVTRITDLDDDSITENTRAAYPITHLDNIIREGKAGHPENIIFLTCDAFGVLPPVSRLTPDQAIYHFLLGYTAKVAGTEEGITEPQATFSTCFGAPFMPLHPSEYARLLGEKIEQHRVTCWLVNTGWTGGPYGIGYRIAIENTRALLNAALGGNLNEADYIKDPVFGLRVPAKCPGVPSEILIPRNTWTDKAAYDLKAEALARSFIDNFRQYETLVPESVRHAGPRL
ncbi:MAG: phosphoenolpyruvate carboxykinase (ATP) [Desulfobacterales bacterium]|nr:phosphoenolpyruvate carboxykinase (ATP) [Desulfobacterales bacterium]MDD4393346.1 phosphoenolpyruvate carboxykinase (ATP) [Desulfobacterales bacterium]